MNSSDRTTVRIAHTSIAVAVALLLAALLAGRVPAAAQAVESKPRTQPAALQLAEPLPGIYVDAQAPQRYCVIEHATFGSFGRQSFVWCALGWGSGGSSVVQIDGSWVGSEIPLHRLDDDGGALQPVVLSSVTLSHIQPTSISIRFGSPGAQSPAYVLAKQ